MILFRSPLRRQTPLTNYVELNRRFVPFDTSAGEQDGFAYSLSSGLGSKTWNDILANRCTVIIAEALHGKTTEMQHRAQALRAAGLTAFFCRLDFLANVQF